MFCSSQCEFGSSCCPTLVRDQMITVSPSCNTQDWGMLGRTFSDLLSHLPTKEMDSGLCSSYKRAEYSRPSLVHHLFCVGITAFTSLSHLLRTLLWLEVILWGPRKSPPPPSSDSVYISSLFIFVPAYLVAWFWYQIGPFVRSNVKVDPVLSKFATKFSDFLSRHVCINLAIKSPFWLPYVTGAQNVLSVE